MKRCNDRVVAPTHTIGSGRAPANDHTTCCAVSASFYHKWLLAAPATGPKCQGMRLWSLHPKYLDQKGLVALWREALLAQAVLKNTTKGYRNHPQLQRFGAQPSPVCAIAAYLHAVHAEAASRGYRFDAGKIAPGGTAPPIEVPQGQIDFEWRHLVAKLEARAPVWREALGTPDPPAPHPLFRMIPGGIAEWERP